MLRTRLWMGAILIAAGLAVLVADEFFAPWYPGWFLLLMALGLITCREMLALVRQDHIISSVLCYSGVLVVIAANWFAHLPVLETISAQPWNWIFGVFIGYFFALFLSEMAIFRQPSGAMIRMALSLWIVAYLAMSSSFLAQLRWLPVENHQGTTALIMSIFVPKCCDMGAYFTGRLLGRTKVAPLLSPKKTWEGALGGLATAAAVTIVVDQFTPAHLLKQNIWAEIGFGVSVGGAGILGDLGESMIKREYEQKDASQSVPGFGGVLDVVDAVMFAGPVAYVWIVFLVPVIQS